MSPGDEGEPAEVTAGMESLFDPGPGAAALRGYRNGAPRRGCGRQGGPQTEVKACTEALSE